MDANGAPAANYVTPAVASATAGGDPAESSWLVFRLGPHTMCASTLDVEGIIEPRSATALPFTPQHILGTFMFRGEVATAISLRKKLRVAVGQDSAKGPYIVARIGDELAAFWVDEVKDVIGEQDVAWQAMPDMLQSRVFDRYTLAREELILHTSFAALLAADAEGIPEQWRARPEDVTADAAAAAPTGAAERVADDDAHDREPESSGETPSSPPESAGSEPDAGAEDDRTETSEPTGAPDNAPGSGRAGGTADAVPRPTYVSGVGARRAGTAGIGAYARRDQAGRGSEFGSRAGQPLTHATRASADLERRERRRRAIETPGHVAFAPIEAAARADYRATANPEPVANLSSETDFGFKRGAYESRREPARTDEAAASDDTGRRRSRSRIAIGLALAAMALLIAIFALWPDRRGEVPPVAEHADNLARGPVVTEPAPRPPAPSVQPDAAASNVAVEKPVEATRVATVETETISLTIERPAKPAARARGGAGAATPMILSRNGEASPGSIVHVVVRGDTLWHIARKYLGNPFRYPELVRLSGIKNPDLIHPGDVVRIRVTGKRR